MRSPCSLCVYVFPLTPEGLNSGTRRDGRLGKYVPAATNTHAIIEELLDAVFLFGPFRIRYSVCSERKVGDWFFPELLVRKCTK
jgi:hypothetical protein